MQDEQIEATQEEILDLGGWLGRHQAFGMLANRCTAAGAECLKRIRDEGSYKKLNMSWADFCVQHAGVSRVYADRLIRHLEEFGANYFKLAELMKMSSETYRLIAGSVTDEGFTVDGETLPMTPRNRKRIQAAVEAARAKPEPQSPFDSARKQLEISLRKTAAAARSERERQAVCDLLVVELNRLGQEAGFGF